MNPAQYTFNSFPFRVFELSDERQIFFDVVEEDGAAEVVVRDIDDAPVLYRQSTGERGWLIRTIKHRERRDDGTFSLTFEDTIALQADGELLRDWDKTDWLRLSDERS